MQSLVLLDWIVILVYFSFIAYIVWWSSRQQKTAEDYFLAGRDIGWFAIGGSLFASNIGSEHIVGLAGQGAEAGTEVELELIDDDEIANGKASQHGGRTELERRVAADALRTQLWRGVALQWSFSRSIAK